MDDLDRLHADLDALRDELRRQGVLSAVLEQRLKQVEADIERCVPLARYSTVERVVYGMIGLVLVSFLSALMALVMRAP